MADTDTPVPRGSSSPDPGISGAIKDAVEAVAKAFGPKAITQRRAKIDTTIDAASGDEDTLGRMRAAQSSDKDNSYAF